MVVLTVVRVNSGFDRRASKIHVRSFCTSCDYYPISTIILSRYFRPMVRLMGGVKEFITSFHELSQTKRTWYFFGYLEKWCTLWQKWPKNSKFSVVFLSGHPVYNVLLVRTPSSLNDAFFPFYWWICGLWSNLLNRFLFLAIGEFVDKIIRHKIRYRVGGGQEDFFLKKLGLLFEKSWRRISQDFLSPKKKKKKKERTENSAEV